MDGSRLTLPYRPKKSCQKLSPHIAAPKPHPKTRTAETRTTEIVDSKRPTRKKDNRRLRSAPKMAPQTKRRQNTKRSGFGGPFIFLFWH
jgi:hypothetical protein